jgi:hypothetical protein
VAIRTRYFFGLPDIRSSPYLREAAIFTTNVTPPGL